MFLEIEEKVVIGAEFSKELVLSLCLLVRLDPVVHPTVTFLNNLHHFVLHLGVAEH